MRRTWPARRRSSALTALLVGLIGLINTACIVFSPLSDTPGPATATPSPGRTPPSGPAQSPPPATLPPGTPSAGPPFPAPIAGQAVYDFAAVLSPEAESEADDLIDTIQGKSGTEIVVYTQYKPDADERSTADDAFTLITDWAIGEPDGDGMVVFWNVTRLDCKVGVPGNGEIQLYAAPGSVERLSKERRQQIFDQDMLPWLRYCAEDDALLAGLETIDELLGVPPTPAPTPSPTPMPTPSGPATGACADPTYTLDDTYWPNGYAWWFDDDSVPQEYDRDLVLEVVKRAFDNITSARNDCGLPDNVTATSDYRGITSDDACQGTTFRNVVGFGKLPRSSDILAYMCPFYSTSGNVPYAHIPINSNVDWSLRPRTCSFGEWDLETTLTHEVGHVFGLGHVGERRHGDLTMSTISNGACDTEELTLGLGDILGLEELYGPP